MDFKCGCTDGWIGNSNSLIYREPYRLMDGWMTCDFTELLRIYQDDKRLIIKDCVKAGLELTTGKLVGQRLISLSYRGCYILLEKQIMICENSKALERYMLNWARSTLMRVTNATHNVSRSLAFRYSRKGFEQKINHKWAVWASLWSNTICQLKYNPDLNEYPESIMSSGRKSCHKFPKARSDPDPNDLSTLDDADSILKFLWKSNGSWGGICGQKQYMISLFMIMIINRVNHV